MLKNIFKHRENWQKKIKLAKKKNCCYYYYYPTCSQSFSTIGGIRIKTLFTPLLSVLIPPTDSLYAQIQITKENQYFNNTEKN